MERKHLLDRDLEEELNRNIDYILTNTSKIKEDMSYSDDVTDISFQGAVDEIASTASSILSVVPILRDQQEPYSGSASQTSGTKKQDEAVRSSAMLLLLSQIRYLQKLTIAMRLHQDG